MRPYRTLLEQKIRERRMTLEEFCTYAENVAREHGEPGTLSLRHLQRLVAGKGPKGQPLGPIRPVTARLLERIFELDSRELLAPPIQAIAPPDDDAADLRDRIQRSRRVDAGMLQGLRNQLNTIRRIDRQYGAIVTHNELLAKIARVRGLFTHRFTGSTRRELAVLLSEMHALAGWQSLDTGHLSVSWCHYEQAKAAALETEDISYHAHAAAEQAFTLIELGETAAAVDLLESIRRSAQHGCPKLLRAWLTAAYGETLAANGETLGALQQFDEAGRLLPSEEVNQEGPYVVLNASHLSRWRGRSTYNPSHFASVNLLMEVIGNLDSTFVRAECATRVDIAIALSNLGDKHRSAEEARRAAGIAAEIGSVRHANRLRDCGLSAN
ncbi:hypothetical protein LCD36_05510 [Saccharopolyspora sp. 6T]|uniref:hypothetical protein n=1 Tax=Saccharopolyspora sp. 6T TaxID=2877238 RepID=UPI001CD70CD4|nr:hypothetical protein [Saccharopolyspora sp. 6T]MCA1185906.1 hypothetical protein [Saccharopolyspora sp. 6T]